MRTTIQISFSSGASWWVIQMSSRILLQAFGQAVPSRQPILRLSNRRFLVHRSIVPVSLAEKSGCSSLFGRHRVLPKPFLLLVFNTRTVKSSCSSVLSMNSRPFWIRAAIVSVLDSVFWLRRHSFKPTSQSLPYRQIRVESSVPLPWILAIQHLNSIHGSLIHRLNRPMRL